MIGLKSMIGFKSIDEMSLNECYAFLKKETPESSGYYGIVKIRYEQLAELTRLQEEKEYKSCKSVADFDRFINKYDKMKPEYQPIHLDDARKMKKRLEEFNARTEAERQQREQREAAERRRRRKIVIASVAGILLVVAIATFFIGYRPVKTLSADNVTFGKEGGEKIVRIETNVSANEIEITEPEKDWVRVALERKTLTISAEENPNPERTCKMTIKAYSTFFGERTGTELSIEILISQNSGYAINDLNVSSRGFSIGKYGGSERVNIKTDGVALEVAPAENCSHWISVNMKSQNHDAQFYHDDDYEINVEKNPAGDRTGKVIVSTGGQPSQEIVINQASGLASSISASPLRIHCNDADGLTDDKYYKVDFSTDGTVWSISKPNWIKVEEVVDATGKGYLKVIPEENEGSYRDGTIYFSSNNGHTIEINVSQDGGPSNLYAAQSTWCPGTGYESKTISVNNDSHYPLSVSSSNTDWLTASVSGNNVTLNCKSTKSGYKSPRKGTVTVKCRNATCSIVVKQDGYKDCGKCKGDGKCSGGQWVANPWGGSVQHSWQEYEVTGSYYDNILGCWLPTYGWVWHNCSQCGGNGNCKECGGKGKVVTQYKSSY